jgi:hypothetical protein
MTCCLSLDLGYLCSFRATSDAHPETVQHEYEATASTDREELQANTADSAVEDQVTFGAGTLWLSSSRPDPVAPRQFVQ